MPFDSATHRPTQKYHVNYFWGIDKNFDNSDTHITTLTHQYRFSPQTQWRTQLRYANYERAYWASAPSNNTAPDVDGNSPKTRKYHTDNLVLQSDFSTGFDVRGMQHELITGIEYLKEDSSRWGLTNQGTDSVPFYSAVVVGQVTTYQGNTYAAYLQDTMEFLPGWKVLFGARRDQLQADYSSLTSPHLEFGEWSYRSGLSWQPTDNAHYYLSWSNSFSPTADLYQLSGGGYPAERSQVTELGGKWLFFQGNLAFRTALYRADKQWERNTDLESTAAILTKKRRTDRLEFELAGRINPKWEVFGGIAFVKAKILQVAENRNATTGVITYANPNFEGQRPRNTPPYAFNLWTTHKLSDTWKVGGGVESKGERYGYNPSSGSSTAFNPNIVPSYARWDGMLAYEQASYSISNLEVN